MSFEVFATIEQALEELRQGRMIILVDDENRENEGDLVIAADKITPQAINFMSQYGRCPIVMPISNEIRERLEIPMMVENNRSQFETAFTVSVEAATGVTTGVSAKDRAHTIKTLADPNSTANDIVMPGHIFPLCAVEGGVLHRSGHTEGSVDLAKMAGLSPATVICEIMNEDGSMARLDDLVQVAKQHELKIVSINDVISYRLEKDWLIKQVAEASMPLKNYGEFNVKVFETTVDNNQHVVFTKGEINAETPVLVRVHSECMTGDIFGSERCDCGPQLDSALDRIAQEGGVLVYMRQEGRGIGLVNKLKAYALQDQGLDTVEANKKLGFSPDHRDYGIGSQILRHIGVKKMRLLTNNPRKLFGVKGYGLELVERVPLEMCPSEKNITYLKTKQEKLGHLLNLN